MNTTQKIRVIKIVIPDFVPKKGKPSDAEVVAKLVASNLKSVGFLVREAFMWNSHHIVIYAEGMGNIQKARELVKDYENSIVTFHIGPAESTSSA